MKNLSKIIEAEGERKKVQEQLRPLQDHLGELTTIIENAETELTFEEKEFINNKLWENLSDSHKEGVLSARKERERMFSGNYAYCMTNEPFDPFYDSWRFVSYRKNEDGTIQIEVSCKRKEGTISGLMTFLDVYWTVPFNMNELGVD